MRPSRTAATSSCACRSASSARSSSCCASPSAFEMQTNTAVISVRGTEWIAEAQRAATAVVALEGQVGGAQRRSRRCRARWCSARARASRSRPARHRPRPRSGATRAATRSSSGRRSPDPRAAVRLPGAGRRGYRRSASPCSRRSRSCLGYLPASRTPAVQQVEAQLLDLRFRLRPPAPPSDDIVLVLIDDAEHPRDRSLALEPGGDRRRSGAAAAAGARTIGLDLLFAEPEPGAVPAAGATACGRRSARPQQSAPASTSSRRSPA